jgi:hypothetical protein
MTTQDVGNLRLFLPCSQTSADFLPFTAGETPICSFFHTERLYHPVALSLVNNEYLRLFLSFPCKRESRVLSEIWIPDQVGNDRKVIIHQTLHYKVDAKLKTGTKQLKQHHE